MWDSLRKGTLWTKGTANGAQAAKKSHNKMSLVQIQACVDSVENFVSGKFRDTWVNHENNEN